MTSTNVGSNLQNFLIFSFNLFAFCNPFDVKFQGHTSCQFKFIELEPRTSLKKLFCWSNPYKILIASLVEMLDLLNFDHMTASTK